MNIAKRPNGKWRARYRDPSGREHSRHFDKKADALRWLAQLKTEMSRGEWLDPALSRVTVGQWATIWLTAQVQLEPSTRVRYESIVRNHVVPVWGAVRLSAVAYADVAAWVQGMLAGGLAPSTVRQNHRVFALVLDHAVRDGRLPRNLAAGVRLPRVQRSGKKYLTHDQVAALASAAGPYGPLVMTLAYTGLRWNEAAGLRVGRVRLDRRELVIAEGMKEVGGHVSFSQTKTHRERVIPFPAVLADELSTVIAGKDVDELVFTSPRGGPLRNGNFRRNVLDQAAVTAGVPGLTPHELRHTAASLAIASGANVKAVQRMLGHASAAMTLDVYADLFDTDHGDVANRLDEAIRTQRTGTGAGSDADSLRTRTTSDAD